MSSSPSSPPLGFGIVGLGMIADFHAQAIAHAAGARLVGVASRDAGKARQFAEKHGAAVAVGSVDELVRRPDIDVVCITTPSGAHRDAALAAIRAGTHVVIEKPIEITTERADEILAAADQAGVKVAPIFQARFGEGARRLKAAIDAGRFGRMVLASAYVKWHRGAAYYTGWKGTRDLDGGGALINQAIHQVDILRWLAGPVDELFAYWQLGALHKIESEDVVNALLRYSSGATGVIQASTAMWPGFTERIELHGTKGSAIISGDKLTLWDVQDDSGEPAPVVKEFASGASDPMAISLEPFERQFREFGEAIREGRPPRVSGEQGYEALEIVDAVYRSCRSGAKVALGGRHTATVQ